MATTNATINISSDIATYPITISKTMTMKKFLILILFLFLLSSCNAEKIKNKN